MLANPETNGRGMGDSDVKDPYGFFLGCGCFVVCCLIGLAIAFLIFAYAWKVMHGS